MRPEVAVRPPMTQSWRLPARQAPWHFLYFLPLPHQQGSLRPTFSASALTTVEGLVPEARVVVVAGSCPTL